ncbi:restriction endonuclease subunit S [Aurantivibrio plasticivorans]
MSWPTAKLSEVAPAKPLKKTALSDDDNVLQITLDHIESNSGRLIKQNYAPVCEAGNSTHWFDSRHVLYSKLRPYLNKVYLPEEQGIGTTELVPMLPDKNLLDRNYLAYYLKSKSFVEWVSSQTAGAKMPRVSMKVFWDHEIPLPPLTEQKRIAAILDKADAIRRKRQQAIQLADDFLRAVFLDMFGDPVTNGWELTTVENMAFDQKGSMRTGPFGSDLKHSEFVDDGVAVLGIDNAVKNRFAWDKKRYISHDKYEQLKRYTVKPGDVLITIMGTCGRCAVVPEDIPTAINTKHLCCITLDKEKCLPSFMHAYFLMHPISRRYLGQTVKGAIMDGLNMGMIKDMPIPKVPIHIQERYEKICNESLANISLQEISSVAVDEGFKSLSQKAFSGHL